MSIIDSIHVSIWFHEFRKKARVKYPRSCNIGVVLCNQIRECVRFTKLKFCFRELSIFFQNSRVLYEQKFIIFQNCLMEKKDSFVLS